MVFEKRAELACEAFVQLVDESDAVGVSDGDSRDPRYLAVDPYLLVDDLALLALDAFDGVDDDRFAARPSTTA